MSDAHLQILPSVAERTNRENHPKPETTIEFKNRNTGNVTSTEVYNWRQALDFAYKNGFTGFSYPFPPQVVQGPNGVHYAVCTVTAHFSDGTSSTAVGDASQENVGPRIAPHFIRMADTRAKARALHDGLNLNGNLREEFGGEDDGGGSRQKSSSNTRRSHKDVDSLPTWQGEDADYYCDGCQDEITGSKRYSLGEVISMSTVGDSLLCYNCRKHRKAA